MSQSENQTNEVSLFSHLRRTAEIESDREALAQLANKRAELKFALDKILDLDINLKNKQSSSTKSESTSSATSSTTSRKDDEKGDEENEEDGVFMATSTSSFFKMCPDDSEKILRVLLEEVEKEIVTICNETQRKLHTHTESTAWRE